MDADDLLRFFDALGQGDFVTVEGCLHEDVALEFPGRRFGGRVVGKRRVAVFLRQNQRLFRGGLRFEVHWAAALGDRGVVQWTNSGTTPIRRRKATTKRTRFSKRPDREDIGTHHGHARNPENTNKGRPGECLVPTLSTGHDPGNGHRSKIRPPGGLHPRFIQRPGNLI